MYDREMPECAKREIPLLRQELHNLKTCQVAFLSTGFTATALLLGLIPKLIECGLSTLGFLTPLVVVLPAFCFFFDKARTITRIVGYYRILESIVNTSALPGWENALARSRMESNRKGKMSKFGRVMLMRRPHGYWALAYHTFMLLCLLCLVGGWRVALSDQEPTGFWGLLIFASILVLACLGRNLYLIWDLTVGESSYEANYQKWQKTLRLQLKEGRKLPGSGIEE
ncbi:MAG TPA: hypothetical protein VMX13_16875 [Sedimentisphaerales bacterium]|nr:hypothetical protein [Sedimentisphaerales bacterium]